MIDLNHEDTKTESNTKYSLLTNENWDKKDDTLNFKLSAALCPYWPGG